MPTKHPEVFVAIIGGILFAVGLWGTVTSSAAARTASDGYLHDCILGTPAADCAQRAAAITGYNSQTLLFETVGAVGFLLIIAAAVLNLILSRKSRRGQ